MKLIKLIIPVFLFIVTVAAQNFEGYVKYKLESEGQVSYVKYFKKGELVRMEPEMTEMPMSGAIIFKDGKTYMVMPSQKMYMEFGDELYGAGQKETESDVDESKPVQTGETKDILGYSCEKWIFNDREYNTEVWAAKGLGEFVFLSLPMGQESMPDWYEDMSNGGFFPMLVEAKDDEGKLEGKMEVVEIKEESLSNDLFDIPSDFTQLKMPGEN